LAPIFQTHRHFLARLFGANPEIHNCCTAEPDVWIPGSPQSVRALRGLGGAAPE
jgi:hypothetical protein